MHEITIVVIVYEMRVPQPVKFVLVSGYTCVRLSCILSFRVHVKLFCRIVSYRRWRITACFHHKALW